MNVIARIVPCNEDSGSWDVESISGESGATRWHHFAHMSEAIGFCQDNHFDFTVEE